MGKASRLFSNVSEVGKCYRKEEIAVEKRRSENHPESKRVVFEYFKTCCRAKRRAPMLMAEGAHGEVDGYFNKVRWGGQGEYGFKHLLIKKEGSILANMIPNFPNI